MDAQSQAPYKKLAAELGGMARAIGTTPAAVLMVSAHWEEPEFTLTAHPNPPMIYDYYGFPDYTYQIRYDAPGHPALAARVKTLIEAAGIPARLDAERGFDHGAFTPLKVMYPAADVPVVQLSLKKGLDPAAHLALGRALAPLRDENVLIVGSGLSYHNLRQFFSPRGWAPSREFDAWLGGVLLAGYASKAAQSMGDPYLLPSIAAVVLGGTSILGGRGTYLGTIAGVILITLLQSILSVMQMPEAGRQIVYGIVIIMMLLLYGRERLQR